MYACIVRRDYYGNPATTRWSFEHTQNGTPKLYDTTAEAKSAAAQLNAEVCLSHNQYAEVWSVTRVGSQRFLRIIGKRVY